MLFLSDLLQGGSKKLAALTSLICLFAITILVCHIHVRKPVIRAQREGRLLHPAQRTLVLYLLNFSDAESLDNFYFFFLEAITRDDTATYEVLVPKGCKKGTSLPELPAHARYVEHDRSCGGLSLARWYLGNHQHHHGENQHQWKQFERVVLVSSAVRGPFIPPGLQNAVTWHVALGLHAKDGLAGGVVSCAQLPARWELQVSEPPFLEFTALAASRAAIDILLKLPPDQLRECPAAQDRGEAVSSVGAVFAEAVSVLAMEGLTAAESEAMIGLRAWSSAVLAAGMGLSSLAVRQQGVNWTDSRTWTCNGGLSPLVERANDGLSLLPYEIMFLPISGYDDVDMPYGAAAEFARTYSEWMHAGTSLSPSLVSEYRAPSMMEPAENGSSILGKDRVTGASEGELHSGGHTLLPDADPGTSSLRPSQLDLITRNRYLKQGNEYKLAGVLVAVAQGEDCFDAGHFLQANPDVIGLSPHEAWKFFVFYAQFQPRPFRLKCGVDWSKFGLRGSGGRRRKGGGGGNSNRVANRRVQSRP